MSEPFELDVTGVLYMFLNEDTQSFHFEQAGLLPVTLTLNTSGFDDTPEMRASFFKRARIRVIIEPDHSTMEPIGLQPGSVNA